VTLFFSVYCLIQVVVDFSATWCGPCKAIAPVYDAISIEKQNRNVMFIKVDVDKNPEIAARYGVKSMPTFLFLKNRKELDRFSGANIVKLKETILNLK
jgi:thioredoxin 1